VARTRLLFGEHLRRARRRRDARDELRAALTVLEASGAEPWAERARTELRASGGGAPTAQETASGLAELTPQELEVARLVAEGSTNREVAARLYMGVRTVESHLGRIYGKLGVNSRVALARLVAGDPES
jgi:DNA-binding NarL/FixJ family response regulator